MLLWLNGGDNSKDSPNENYGREMMELFTLGHGSGYTEDDVREQARALTGWRYDWTNTARRTSATTPRTTTRASKTIFGLDGHFTWKDSCRLCVSHPAHAPFFVVFRSVSADRFAQYIGRSE